MIFYYQVRKKYSMKKKNKICFITKYFKKQEMILLIFSDFDLVEQKELSKN